MVVQALMLVMMETGEGVKCMTIVMRVQERQGETKMNLACVIFTLSGAHVMFPWRWLVGQKLDVARADAASMVRVAGMPMMRQSLGSETPKAFQ
jgi:hypothetical protein